MNYAEFQQDVYKLVEEALAYESNEHAEGFRINLDDSIDELHMKMLKEESM